MTITIWFADVGRAFEVNRSPFLPKRLATVNVHEISVGDQPLSAMIREIFVSGVSIRKVGDILEVPCDERVSAGYDSKAVKEIDGAVWAYDH